MIESLTEMSDAVRSCERALVHYRDSKLQDFVSRLYVELFEILKASHGIYSNPSSLRENVQLIAVYEVGCEILEPMAEMRRLSQVVLREVDYLHRVELRETSSEVTDMQIEQRKILTTLEDQRRILKSLQEERRIIGVVQEQQKILQIVQQIQGAMQMRGASELASS